MRANGQMSLPAHEKPRAARTQPARLKDLDTRRVAALASSPPRDHGVMNAHSNRLAALFDGEEQLAEMCVHAAESDDFDRLVALARSSKDPVLLAVIVAGLAAEARLLLAAAAACGDRALDQSPHDRGNG